jgi:single-stranded DNA-specific DHH superfamily exonuclease
MSVGKSNAVDKPVLALVPLVLSSKYLNKSLCGAGVTWQFIRAMDVLYNTNLAEGMIDLAAFATIADVMKITTSEK